MRDLDHAITLVEATVQAANVPVTLKMRLGWDHQNVNAPDLAHRAEMAGVAMITVHGRTRCQFYGGRADWDAIARVREAISIPLIANGDAETESDARLMLARSGADGIMMGRAAYGRPWWPGVIAERLDPGSGIREPGLAEEARIVRRHHADMLSYHGPHHGNRLARKHLGWVIGRLAERRLIDTASATTWRATLLRSDDNCAVAGNLALLYERCLAREAA
jgi:nifR3 family TIM-barrel protein